MAIGIGLAFVAGIIALVVVGNNAQKNEQASKNLLASEIAQLTIPATCTEKSRVYQSGGIDTQSAWFVQYECATTGVVAYDSITGGLQKLGFKEEEDFSKQSPDRLNLSYTFTYKSEKFRADYRFEPEANVGLSEISQLKASPVTLITLALYRR